MRWFVEEKRFDGGWSPAVYHGDRPDEKRTDGRRSFRRPPELVPDYMGDLDLKQLMQFLSPDGEFYGFDPMVQKAVIAYQDEGKTHAEG